MTDIRALAQRCYLAAEASSGYPVGPGAWMSEHMDDAQRIGWQAAATVAYDQGVADGVAKERDRCLAIAREVFGSEIARMIESGEAP